jgi:hypothetical protein
MRCKGVWKPAERKGWKVEDSERRKEEIRRHHAARVIQEFWRKKRPVG